MKFRELLIRFKRKPTYEDLVYVANDAVLAVIDTAKGKQLLELLHVPNLDNQWSTVQLNNRVQALLMAVSSGESRSAQAKIFRRHMLVILEQSETNRFIFDDRVRLEFWLKHTYSKDLSVEESQRGQLFMLSWAFENLMAVIVSVIYRTQYEVTLGLDEFKDLYTGLVITNFELLLNTLIASDENIESKYAESYMEFVSRPLLDLATSLNERCVQAIIGGDSNRINSLRAEAVVFGRTYQQAIDLMKACSD